VLKNSDIFRFTDPRNLRIGRARIIWGDKTIKSDGTPLAAAWVLPGGSRTQNAAVALNAANIVNSLMR
jgi:hypothetical protein